MTLKTFSYLIAGLLFWSSTSLGRAQIEYIDSSRLEALNHAFDSATAPQPDDLNMSQWNCEMYGLSSRLQVEKDLKLYFFKTHNTDKDVRIKNSGAQMVKSYQLASGEILGVNGSLRDHIRMSKEGRLISKLELISPKQKQNSRTLAISSCTKLKI